jgi:hypothetical protein
MRRAELISASENLADALKQSKVQDAVTSLLRSTSERANTPPIDLVRAMRTYMLAYQTFGDAELELISILGLDLLNDDNFWSSLLAQSESAPGPLHHVYRRTDMAIEILPIVLAMLKQRSATLQADLSEVTSRQVV